MIRALIVAMFMTCLLATGANAQEAKAIPSLKGVWEGVAEMHFKEHGHLKPSGKTTKLEVLSQEGRVIHGTVSWTSAKASGKDEFSGVIDKDGVTIYMAGHAEGLRIAKLEGPDAFTMYLMTPGGAKPRAGFVEFKRVK